MLILLLCAILISTTNLRSQVNVTHGQVTGAVTSASAKILVRVDGQANIRFDLAPNRLAANLTLTGIETLSGFSNG